MTTVATKRDYSLLGRDAEAAVAKGLSAAEWYHTDIPRKQMKELMKRDDGPATRDTFLGLGSMALFGGLGIYFWGTWGRLPFFLAYGVRGCGCQWFREIDPDEGDRRNPEADQQYLRAAFQAARLCRKSEGASDAGLANGFSVSLNNANSPPASTIAQSLQSTFAQGGVTLTLEQSDRKQVLTKHRARDHDITLIS